MWIWEERVLFTELYHADVPDEISLMPNFDCSFGPRITERVENGHILRVGSIGHPIELSGGTWSICLWWSKFPGMWKSFQWWYDSCNPKPMRDNLNLNQGEIVRQMVLLSSMARMPRSMSGKIPIDVRMGLASWVWIGFVNGKSECFASAGELNWKTLLIGPLPSCSTTHPHVHENLTCTATLVYVANSFPVFELATN